MSAFPYGPSFTSVYQRLLTNGTDGCAGQRKLRGSFARKEPGGTDRPIFSNILSQTNNPLISKKIIIWWQTRRISCFWQNSLPQESARGCPLCHRVGGSCHLVSLCHLVTLPPCHLATLSLLPVTLSTFQTVEGSNRLLWILMWSLFNLKWAKTSHQFNVWRKAGNWKVMWDEPEPELSHGTVIRYNIGYKQVDDDGDDNGSGGGGLFWSKKSNYFERLSDIFESVSVVVSLIPLFFQFGSKSPHQFYDLDRYQWHKTRCLLSHLTPSPYYASNPWVNTIIMYYVLPYLAVDKKL